jgi:hypothetical protein
MNFEILRQVCDRELRSKSLLQSNLLVFPYGYCIKYDPDHFGELYILLFMHIPSYIYYLSNNFL